MSFDSPISPHNSNISQISFVRWTPPLLASRFPFGLTWSTWKTRRAHFCGIPDKGRGNFRPPPARPAVRPPGIPDPRTRRILPGCWRAWNPMEFAYVAAREKLQRGRCETKYRRVVDIGKIRESCLMRCLLNTVVVRVVILCFACNWCYAWTTESSFIARLVNFSRRCSGCFDYR